MSYPPGRGPQKKKNNYLWVAVFIVAVPVLLVAAVVTILANGENSQERADRISRETDAEFAADKTEGPLLVKLKASYPKDYGELKDAILEARSAKVSPEEMTEVTNHFMRRFVIEHRWDMADAPAADLKHLRDVQLETMLALQKESEVQCAASVMGVEPPGGYSATADAAMFRDTSAVIEAALAGQKARQAASQNASQNASQAGDVKRRGSMTQADYVKLFGALEAEGLSKDQLALLKDRNKLAAAPVAEQCNMGVALMRAVTKLPEDAAERVTLELILNGAES